MLPLHRRAIYRHSISFIYLTCLSCDQNIQCMPETKILSLTITFLLTNYCNSSSPTSTFYVPYSLRMYVFFLTFYYHLFLSLASMILSSMTIFLASVIVILNPAGVAECPITRVHTLHLSFPTNLLGNWKRGINHISTTELQRKFIFLCSILTLRSVGKFHKGFKLSIPILISFNILHNHTAETNSFEMHAD